MLAPFGCSNSIELKTTPDSKATASAQASLAGRIPRRPIEEMISYGPSLMPGVSVISLAKHEGKNLFYRADIRLKPSLGLSTVLFQSTTSKYKCPVT
jgi:hypothetical protein